MILLRIQLLLFLASVDAYKYLMYNPVYAACKHLC
jgi:hypothetical protein